MGAKLLVAGVQSDLSERKLLGRVAAALKEVSGGPGQGCPWRVQGGARDDPQTGTKFFIAEGQYRWNSATPRLRPSKSGGMEMIFASPTFNKQGGGVVQLKAGVSSDGRSDTLAIQLLFQDTDTPMWLRQEAEALVAMTIAGITAPLERLAGPLEWSLVRGGWVHYHLLSIPGRGTIEIGASR
jgi:hypothetical protein